MEVKELNLLVVCKHCGNDIEIEIDSSLLSTVERKVHARLLGHGWKYTDKYSFCSELCLFRFKERVYEK